MAYGDIKVEFLLTSDDMTDEDYENQEEQEFIVTQDMIYELVRQNAEYPKDKEPCPENFWINMVR